MKKLGFANICISVSSLAISILLLVLWCCNVGGFSVVSLDSFVGVIVALLAVIVTLVVGWQIYNVIEMKEKMEKLHELEVEFNKHKEMMRQQDYTSKEYINIIIGYEAIKEKKYNTAFHFFIYSLEYAMQQRTPSPNIKTLLNWLEACVNGIANESTINQKTLESNKKIRLSVNYPLIKDKYEKIYNTFESKIKKV